MSPAHNLEGYAKDVIHSIFSIHQIHPRLISSIPNSIPLTGQTTLPILYLHLILIHLLTLDHLTERTLLHHQAHNLIQRIRSSHGGMLSIGIICRCNLNDISSDDVDALQSTKDSAEFASGPSTCLGGTGSWGDYSLISIMFKQPNDRR